MESSDDKLLDGTAGIAEHFGLPRRAVQHWIENHGMPVVRIGRRIYGKPSVIGDWIEAHTQATMEGTADD